MQETLNPDIQAIRAILWQVRQTKLDLGHYQGHGITQAQYQQLINHVENLISSDSVDIKSSTSGRSTPATTNTFQDVEDGLRLDREKVKSDIRALQTAIPLAHPSNRSQLNSQLGQLLSRRAALDRALQNYNG